MNRYLFIIRGPSTWDFINNDSVDWAVDAFHEVQSDFTYLNQHKDQNLDSVLQDMSEVFGEQVYPESLGLDRKDVEVFKMMCLRVRFNQDSLFGPFLLKTEDELEMDGELLQQYIDTMTMDEMKQFMRESKL